MAGSGWDLRGSSSPQGFSGEKVVNIFRAWREPRFRVKHVGMGWAWQLPFLAQTSPVLLTRRSSAACRAVGALALRVAGGTRVLAVSGGRRVTGTGSDGHSPGRSPERVGAPRPFLLTQLQQRGLLGSSVCFPSRSQVPGCPGIPALRDGAGTGHMLPAEPCLAPPGTAREPCTRAGAGLDPIQLPQLVLWVLG